MGRKKRYVVVFWPLRRGRLRPEDRIQEEWQAATDRIRRIERGYVESLPVPRRFTIEDGSVWHFGAKP